LVGGGSFVGGIAFSDISQSQAKAFIKSGKL
jgi:hypothetical protein